MDFASTAPMLASPLLKPHGSVVVYGSNTLDPVPVPFFAALFNSLTLRFFLVYDLSDADRERAISGLAELLAQGTLEHTIGPRFSLNDIAAAHRAVQAGVAGNVVIEFE